MSAHLNPQELYVKFLSSLLLPNMRFHYVTRGKNSNITILRDQQEFCG